MDILTLNCGSSSVKYQLYRWSEKRILAKGIVERVTIGGSFIKHEVPGRETVKIASECPTHKEAIELILKTLVDQELGVIKDVKEVKAVGHRVVHGGEKFNKSVLITDEALRTFEELQDLAPLHNPPNILGIKAAMNVLPDVPHVAIMDTAWHQTMPEHAFIYALPREWYEKYHIRRYGFHGTSFLYVAKRAAVLLGKNPFETNVVIAHLGNGASIDAVKNGISVDTSMGFTPLEGLVMGTRAGDHDAAIDLYMMDKLGLSSKEMNDILNKKSGVFGITNGKYTDRRDIEIAAEQGDPLAQLAIDIETYRLKKYISAYMGVLGRVDAIVFTAGVGEMGPIFREKALIGLENFGVVIDKKKNNLSLTRNAETDITGEGSKVRVFVIPTDEELVMTEDTVAIMEGRYDVHTNFTYSFQDPKYKNLLREENFAKEVEKKPDLANIRAKIPGVDF
ncbi:MULTISPECIES: acetate kinase [Caldisericum]|jgi:acetate kinase|uniref:Acetate kinase n=1 Tax=Caldisericum exile TaxID=693075 RepID=A0A2J6WDW5_9BACT|nr:MAG: propionate kinase [Caldisericum exile]